MPFCPEELQRECGQHALHEDVESWGNLPRCATSPQDLDRPYLIVLIGKQLIKLGLIRLLGAFHFAVEARSTGLNANYESCRDLRHARGIWPGTHGHGRFLRCESGKENVRRRSGERRLHGPVCFS